MQVNFPSRFTGVLFLFLYWHYHATQAAEINPQVFSLIPSSAFKNVTATSTTTDAQISCFSAHNQLYTNNIELHPPPTGVLADNDFTISVIFTALLGEQRYLLIFYDQSSLEVFFGLYVTPESSEVGITYQTCSGGNKTVPIFNPAIQTDTELFLSISISPLNSTHLAISSLIGNDPEVSVLTVSGSLECSFPEEETYATHLSFDSEGEPMRFFGSSKDLLFVGRSLTSDEMEILRTDGELNKDSCHTDCICPTEFDLLTESCCFNPQTNTTTFRTTSEAYLPESATDGNPCTYWQSSSGQENVSLSFSLSPLLPELQLIQVQFVSPPAKLTLSVTSQGTLSVVAYVSTTCDSAADNPIYTCLKDFSSFEETPCCVTTEQLMSNPVFEILFSFALQNVSSVTLSLSELAPSHPFYSISKIQLFSLAELDILNQEFSTSPLSVTSTMEYSRTSVSLSSTADRSMTSASSQTLTPVSIPESSLPYESSSTSILTHSSDTTHLIRQSSSPREVLSTSVAPSTRVVTHPVASSRVAPPFRLTSTYPASSLMQTHSSTPITTKLYPTESSAPLSSTSQLVSTSSPPPTSLLYSMVSSVISSLFPSSTDELPTPTPSSLLTTSTLTDILPKSTMALPTSTLDTSSPTSILPTPTSTVPNLAPSSSTPTSTSSVPTSTPSSVLPTSTSTLDTSSSTLTSVLPTSSFTSTPILPTSTPVPPTPTPAPTPILPCSRAIPLLHLDIAVPSAFGYKQYHFADTYEDTAVSVIQTSVGTESAVTVGIPFGLTKTYKALYSLPPLSELEYFIHSTTIWNQDNHLPISITGLDSYKTLNFRETNLTLTLSHNSTSVSEYATLSRLDSSETILFTLPDLWFSSLVTSVSPSLLVTSPNKLLLNTTLSLLLHRPKQASLLVPTDSRPVVIITLPQFPIRTGQTAVLPVYLLSSSGARYVVIRFVYPRNSTLVNLDPSFSWEFNHELDTVVISGSVNIPAQEKSPVRLFDINMIFLSDDRQVACELKEALDSTYTRANAPACYFSGLSGVSPSPGYLYTSPDAVFSISAHPEHSVTYNHAVFTQSILKIPVYVRIYTNNGVRTDPNLLSCYSTDPSVLKIATSCSYLFMNGSEVSGANSLAVHFSFGNLETQFNMKVFYPDIPITLTLTDPILNFIPEFPSRPDCVQKFQSSKLLAYTNFTASNEVTPSLDISQYISLSVSSEVAGLGDDLYLHGKSAGVGQIYAEIEDTRVGHTVFVVSMEPVEVSCYSPHVYSDYAGYNTEALHTSLYQSRSLEVSLQRTFLYNSTRGYPLTFLQFSDDNTQPTPHYTLTATHSIPHGDSTFSLLDNSMVVFNLPSSCPSLSPLPLKTQLDLHPPDDFTTHIASQILSIAGDVATQFGYQTSAEIRVSLVYGSELVAATNAAFTHIQIQNVNIINLVNTERGLVLESQSSPGQTDVTVSLDQFQTTKSLSIQVVSATGLQSALFAPSSPLPITTLSRLTPDTFQTGQFEVRLVLSNTLTIPVTNTSELQVREPTDLSDTDSPVTDKAYFTDSILSVNATLVTSDSTVELTAAYAGFLTSYEVFISTDALSVSDFSEFDVIPDLTGTLASQFPVNFGLTLSDGTEIPRYFGDSPTLPDLRFEVSDPSSIFFHSATGMIALIGNSRDLVYLRVSSGDLSRISNGFAVNLSPFGNGIDLGNENGLALPHQKTNSTFKLPVWLQSHSDYKSVDVSVTYEASVLSVVRVVPDFSFRGGIFQSQHNTGGMLRLGGIVPSEKSGDRILLAEIELVATQARDASVQAEVNSLSGPFPLYANILNYTYPVVTNLTQVVYAQKRSAVSHPWSDRGARSVRGVLCVERAVSPSGRDVCVKCSTEVRGDVNRDCNFNLNDVSYLFDYVTASYTGFSSDSGRLLKQEVEQLPLSLSDINQDADISITDVYYLNWINFGLICFLDTVDTSLHFPTGALPSVYDCELVVRVELVDAPLTSDQFRTYLELSYTDTSVELLNITQGEYLSNASRSGISSGIYGTEGFVLRRVVPASLRGQIHISPILIATDGTDILQQAFTSHSLPSLNYPGLTSTVPFLSSQVSINIPTGYTPYTSYTPPQVCGAPSVELRVLGALQARQLTLYWPQTGGRGPFSLKRVFCAMRGREYNKMQLPCNRQITTNSNAPSPEYRVTGLNPYSVYQFQMEVGGVTSQWTQFKTPEAAPVSLLPPSLTRYNLTCTHLSWEEPEITNGVIQSYSLILNDTASLRFTNETTSHLLCGVDADHVLRIVIQANNSAGGVRSNSTLSNSIGKPTVLSNRYNSSCVEIIWTHLVFRRSSNPQETFAVSVDNSTVAIDHNSTGLLVCELVRDGVPFYLEITSSRVGKIFADNVTIPVSAPFPYHILLAVLLPLLAALLLLLCCITVAVCLWKSRKHSIFKPPKAVQKSRDYWSTEEEFVEVSPVDIQPMEQRLFVPQENRDRSDTFDSNDSWLEKGPTLDVEQGLLTHGHEREDSFDSASVNITQIQDDSYYTVNNTTMASDDTAISPRLYYSLRGRPRFLPPGSDLRKTKKSHSWHNLRHKRFRRSTAKLTKEIRRSSELYQNSNREDTTEVVGESITSVTDTTASDHIANGDSPGQPREANEMLIDVSTEMYQNNAASEVVEVEERSISPVSGSSDELSRDVDSPLPEDDAPVSKPQITHTPAPAPIQDDTVPTLSETYVNIVEETPNLDEVDPSPDAPLEEATISAFASQRENRTMVTRPSLDLSAGHVIGMTLAYEHGDLPLEENKPHPYSHKRSFTALPVGEEVNRRRSVFEEQSDPNDDSEPKVFVLLNNPVTSPEPTDNTSETQNTEFTE